MSDLDKRICGLIPDSKHVFPGWGCCVCASYNGLQRKFCKRCGHECCNPDKPLPEKYNLCNVCGIPLDSDIYKTFYGGPVKHIGHTVTEESKSKQ